MAPTVFLRRRGTLAPVGVFAAAIIAVRILGTRPQGSDQAFASGAALLRGSGRATVALQAQAAAPAPAPAPSVALVKVTEETKVTTASVLGGIAGLLVGGLWVGGALFAATAYLTRKEDSDVAKALKGVAGGSLEALNFGSYLNDKYAVTGKVGAALSDAAANAKRSSAQNKETLESAESFLQSVTKAIADLDKDVGIKDTLGNLATSASDLASQAVGYAVETNKQYKITDKIKDAVEKALEQAQATASSSAAKPK